MTIFDHSVICINDNLTIATIFSVISDGTVTIDTVVLEGSVNGIDISDLEASAIYKDSNDTISGKIVFVNGIDCKQNLSVAGLINGVNLTELFNQSVRISIPQVVTGRKTFVANSQQEVRKFQKINWIQLRKT